MYKTQWTEFLNEKQTVLIFDTETTGLIPSIMIYCHYLGKL